MSVTNTNEPTFFDMGDPLHRAYGSLKSGTPLTAEESAAVIAAVGALMCAQSDRQLADAEKALGRTTSPTPISLSPTSPTAHHRPQRTTAQLNRLEKTMTREEKHAKQCEELFEEISTLIEGREYSVVIGVAHRLLLTSVLEVDAIKGIDPAQTERFSAAMARVANIIDEPVKPAMVN